MYFVVTVYSTFGRGSTGVSVFVLYLLLWVVLFSFILSHWEKYNTGILFLPWGYDISQVVSTRCRGFSRSSAKCWRAWGAALPAELPAALVPVQPPVNQALRCSPGWLSPACPGSVEQGRARSRVPVVLSHSALGALTVRAPRSEIWR